MEIKPSTSNKPATIELSSEDKERIDQITPDFFSSAPAFPEGICSTSRSVAVVRGSRVCKVQSEK